MVVFNTEFQASFSPSEDETIRAEFARAHQLVRDFAPSSETADVVFARVQQAFSATTRDVYGRNVRAFVRAAKKELDERASAVGISSLAIESYKRPAVECDEALSAKKQKEVCSNFSNVFHVFFNFNKNDFRELKGVINEEKITLFWDDTLNRWKQFCEEFKWNVSSEGIPQEERDALVAALCKRAGELVQAEKNRAIDILNQVRKLERVFGVDLKEKGFSLLSCFVSLKPKIESILKSYLDKGFSFFEVCRTFFLCNEEIIPETAWARLCFLLKFFEHVSLEGNDCKAFAENYFRVPYRRNLDVCLLKEIGEKFSDPLFKRQLEVFEVWASRPEHAEELAGLSLQQAQENAQIECEKLLSTSAYRFLLSIFFIPQKVESFLFRMSPGTLNLLQKESFLSVVHKCVGGLFKEFDFLFDYSCAGGNFFYDLEPLFHFINNLHQKYPDIEKIDKNIFASFLLIVQKMDDPIVCDFLVNPHSSLWSFSADQMLECFRSLTVMLAFFLFHKVPFDVFRKIASWYPKRAPSREVVSFFKNISAEDLEACIFLRDNLFFEQPVDLNDVVKIKSILEDKEALSLLRRICRGRPPTSDQARTLLDFAIDCSSFFCFPNPIDSSDENDAFIQHIPQFYSCLNQTERWVCLYNLPADMRIHLFYQSESLGLLEEDIQEQPLSLVPTEILLRYLGSKPFAEIQKWLKDSIPFGESGKSRLDTLLPKQRQAILHRFTRYESALPLKEWMDLFEIGEEHVEIPFPPSSLYGGLPLPMRTMLRNIGLEGANLLIDQHLDVYDPFSLFFALRDFCRPGRFFAHDLPLILFMYGAREEQVCGGRTFLAWGNAQPESSPCCSQDDAPLHARYKGKPITIYPRGLFNDITFGAAAVTLRRKWYDITTSSQGFEGNEFARDPELRCELLRISKNLFNKYPQLAAFANGKENPELGGSIVIADELVNEKTFCDLFKKGYKMLVRGYTQAGERVQDRRPRYNCNNPVHRHAFMYMTLLNLVRNVRVAHENNVTKITFSKNVFFLLRSLSREDLQVLPEDNPGISNLERYAADYPLHTLSPITPADITPKMFEEFAFQVQLLDDATLEALSDSIIPFLFCEIPDDVPYENYFDAWKAFWPQGTSCDAARPVMISLSKNYYGPVDVLTEALLPNKMYLLDRNGIKRFSREEDVPGFVRHLGSFASAVCAFYVPRDPERHDGNCAVNAFLLGLFGPRAYSRGGGRNLSRDIQEFRHNIVSYALEHVEELKNEFGEQAFRALVCNYNRNNGFDSWTTREVWVVAARKYRRIINVFNADCHGGYFRTNAEGALVPFDEENEVFKPQGDVSGPPINLLMWGPHYCFLEAK